MSRLAVVFLCFVFSGLANANGFSLSIEVQHLSHDKGEVIAYLYNDASAFPTKPKLAIAQQASKIIKNQAHLSFTNLQAGVYAIAVIHDENGNRKLDSNWLGIPKEPVGASNDAKGHFGPPKFEDAKFNLDKNMTIKINMVTDGNN